MSDGWSIALGFALFFCLGFMFGLSTGYHHHDGIKRSGMEEHQREFGCCHCSCNKGKDVQKEL